MLALNEIELKQTRFYQEIAEEERQEGRQEGRKEGEQILLQRMLTRRFGDLPEWAQQQLLKASPKQLEQWADRLLDAPSLLELFND
jgi:predicted transposase YdaD